MAAHGSSRDHTYSLHHHNMYATLRTHYSLVSQLKTKKEILINRFIVIVIQNEKEGILSCYFYFYYYFSVTLRVPQMDSEARWTRELLWDFVFLILQNYKNKTFVFVNFFFSNFQYIKNLEI